MVSPDKIKDNADGKDNIQADHEVGQPERGLYFHRNVCRFIAPYSIIIRAFHTEYISSGRDVHVHGLIVGGVMPLFVEAFEDVAYLFCSGER